jgi:hypothetical protein
MIGKCIRDNPSRCWMYCLMITDVSDLRIFNTPCLAFPEKEQWHLLSLAEIVARTVIQIFHHPQ